MTLFLRISISWILIVLGPVIWFSQNGFSVERKIGSNSIIGERGYSSLAPVISLPLTNDVTDTIEAPTVADLALFENGVSLGPANATVDAVSSKGHGAFVNWGHSLHFSSSDGTDPKENNRSYMIKFRAYPTLMGQVAPIFTPIVLLGGLMVVWTITSTLFRGLADRLHGRPARLALLVTTLVLACTAMELRLVGKPTTVNVRPENVEPISGYAYVFELPPSRFFDERGEFSGSGTLSDLQVFENDKEIGPAHAMHDAIATLGGGLFSHWDGHVRFSTKVNSDPRNNGKVYTLKFSKYLKPQIFWFALAAFFLSWTPLALLPLMTDSSLFVIRKRNYDWSITIDDLRSFLGLSSTLRLLLLTFAYMILILMITESLKAQQSKAGALNINFEYKVF